MTVKHRPPCSVYSCATLKTFGCTGTEQRSSIFGLLVARLGRSAMSMPSLSTTRSFALLEATSEALQFHWANNSRREVRSKTEPRCFARKPHHAVGGRLEPFGTWGMRYHSFF